VKERGITAPRDMSNRASILGRHAALHLRTPGGWALLRPGPTREGCVVSYIGGDMPFTLMLTHYDDGRLAVFAQAALAAAAAIIHDGDFAGRQIIRDGLRWAPEVLS
jgi:hypothetical protein